MLLKKLHKLIFILCCLGMIFSFSKRNYFPERWNVTAEAANDPLQNPTIQLPFKIKKGENEFFIEPLYDYKITGIVVSYRQHDLENGLHKKWGEKGDNLNISDICVVWGSNIKSELLNHIDFYNGDYTCFFETKSQSVFDSFKQDQLSNNHLLSADQRIIKKINQIIMFSYSIALIGLIVIIMLLASKLNKSKKN